MKNVVFFNKDLKKVDEKVRAKLGIRGRRAVDLAAMGFPIAPGFIIDSELTKKIPDVNIKEILKSNIAELEKELYEEINRLGVGPMGVGGETTCLAVKINYFPMHIASLPVAINIQCHSARHTEVII